MSPAPGRNRGLGRSPATVSHSADEASSRRSRQYADVSMHPIRFPGESTDLRRARALRERVDDLRSARARILAAADAERRRIERDLHDGAQQRLVAVTLTLGLAESRVASDPVGAAALIAQAREEVQFAVKELRELARGIHPAVLSDRGLGAALEALASRAPVPVEIAGVPEQRLRPALEAAVYFSTAEALTNVAKYSKASAAFVHIAVDGDKLRLQIGDDGVGGADLAAGGGLRGLCDRADALDGSCQVHSPEGCGTTVTVELPLQSAPAAG
jgi:signal transduction histidine kinase